MIKFVSNVIRKADLWNKKHKERVKLSRLKKQDYFVNVIDVAQNAGKSVTLVNLNSSLLSTISY